MDDGKVATIVIVAVYAAAGAALLLLLGAARLARRAARDPGRQAVTCDRDMPQHDRVTLTDAQRRAWMEFRARFELEAEAEERARLAQGGDGDAG